MALVSPEGKWLQVNRALCKLLGYPPERLYRLTFQEITHPDDLNADLSQLHDLLDGHISSYTMEKRYIRSDGQTVWALLAVSLVRDAEGQPLYFISGRGHQRPQTQRGQRTTGWWSALRWPTKWAASAFGNG